MNAIVLLSGGADSAICASWAKDKFADITCIGFNYGQSHKRELISAQNIANILDSDFYEVAIPIASKSSLTGGRGTRRDLPSTFVPCRNLVFLSLAASFAIENNCRNLVTGVCQTDYSGYPDCRREFIDSFEHSVHLANSPEFHLFQVYTPLMHMTKAESVIFAKSIPRAWECLSNSWTCYLGKDVPCKECDACLLRQKGFEIAGMYDPALV